MKGESPRGAAGLHAPIDAARPRALPTTGQVSTKRLLAAALAVVVLPKCLLCLAGYLAAGGAVVELCGGTADDRSAIAWWIGGATGTALLAAGWLFGFEKRLS